MEAPFENRSHTQVLKPLLRINRIIEESCCSADHPAPVMSTVVARSRQGTCGFWRNQTTKSAIVNDLVWVGSSRDSDRAANGGFASFLENSCRSGIDPGAEIAQNKLAPRI